VGLLALGGGSKKKGAAPPPKIRLIGAFSPHLTRGTPQPTVAQLLIAQQKELLAEVEEAGAIRFAQARTHRPRADAEPADIAAWANDYHLNATELRVLMPGLGWFRNPDVKLPFGAHPETAWRAQYKFGSDGAVSWWANKDLSWGYEHVWGGFDLWKTLSDIANALEDAASWLKDAMSRVDWKAIAADIESVSSMVPVLGTAVSDIVASAVVLADELSSAPPLEKLVNAAYDYALASIPGGASLHGTLDPVVDAIIKVALKGERLSNVIIDDIAKQAPDHPDIEGINPRRIATSLLVIVAHALGVKT
jgi:hypothetical protein